MTQRDSVVGATQLQGKEARILAARVAAICIMAMAEWLWRWQRGILSLAAGAVQRSRPIRRWKPSRNLASIRRDTRDNAALRSNPYKRRTTMWSGVVSGLYPSQTRAVSHPRQLSNGWVRPVHRRVTGIAWSSSVSIGGALAILAAELLTRLNPVAGMILHATVFCMLLALAASSTTLSKERFALGLALVPLIRMVSLAIPASSFDQTVWYIVTAIPLFAASMVVVQATSLNRGDLNLRLPKPRYWIASVAVAISGLVIGSVEYMLLRPPAMSSEATLNHLILTIEMLVVATGFLEEFVFRGILLGGAQGIMRQSPAILYTAVIFATLHIGQVSAFHVLFVLAVGVYFGVVVSRTQSLYAVAVAHGLANVMLFVVLPLRLG